jgi:anti-sigma factor RsiW
MPKHPKTHTLDCTTAEPLFEAYVDGELAMATSAAFEAHLGHCAACCEELELSQRIRGGLRSLSPQECPRAVTAAVLAHAERHPTWIQRLAAWLAPAPPRIWQGALAMLVVAALAFGYFRGTPVVGPTSGPGTTDYSAADVAHAEAELKLALAYLGRIGETAGDSVGIDVLGKRVMGPVKESIAGALLPRLGVKEVENGGTT